jgi:hypothetical protein
VGLEVVDSEAGLEVDSEVDSEVDLGAGETEAVGLGVDLGAGEMEVVEALSVPSP